MQDGPLLSSYKRSYNPYKWPNKWVTGVITARGGVTTLLITGSGPHCGHEFLFLGRFLSKFVSQVVFVTDVLKTHQTYIGIMGMSQNRKPLVWKKLGMYNVKLKTTLVNFFGQLLKGVPSANLGRR